MMRLRLAVTFRRPLPPQQRRQTFAARRVGESSTAQESALDASAALIDYFAGLFFEASACDLYSRSSRRGSPRRSIRSTSAAATRAVKIISAKYICSLLEK